MTVEKPTITKYILLCFFCLCVCIYLGKQGHFQNITFITLHTRDYFGNQFGALERKMATILKDPRYTLGESDEYGESLSKSINNEIVEKRPPDSLKNLKEVSKISVDKTLPVAKVKPKQPLKRKPGKKLPRSKIILWYIKPRFIQYSPRLHDVPNCKWRCQETTNQRYYNQSSAILFVAQTMRILPPKRYSPDQVFVIHNHEAPINGWRFKPSFRKPEWRNQINWTMSYRQDSDIVYPYGVIKKRETEVKKDYTTIVHSKKKMAAWMVSHCKTNSRREKYVQELKKYLPIDIFGRCGSKKCARGSETKCRKLIAKDYKFYLSFENARCEDYVTEKFFRQYNENLITVVRGGKNYSHIAQNGVYINTADFKNPKALADHLLAIDKNDTAYEYMLRQKDKYEAVFEKYELLSGRHVVYTNYHYKIASMCTLCERVWNPDKYTKYYENINEWFDDSTKACFTANDV